MPPSPIRSSCILTAYVAAVIGTGGGLVTALGLGVGTDVARETPAALWLLVPLVILGELLPMPVPGRQNDEVTLSTAFGFALLLIAGAPAAVLVQAGASLIADARQRKPAHVALFNAAQYAIALAAAGAVVYAASGVPRATGQPFLPEDLPGVALGGLVFFALNQGLAGTVQALSARRSVLRSLLEDGRSQAWSGATLLALAPLVVVAVEFSSAVVPLLALPLAAVYRGSRQAVENQHQALHDGLTGLPNRVLLHDRLDQAVLSCARDGSAGAVMLLDLDRFKDVNDTLGHAHGDELLRQVGPRLLAVLRAGDTVARLGGDEFAILLPCVEREAIGVVAGRVVEALERPFEIDGVMVDIGASVGVARYPDHGEDVGTLLQRADTAMYRAKEAGGRWESYEAADDGHSRGRLALVGELRRALERGELVVHYQPKADVVSGEMRGVEALVRWSHPERGMLAPDEFIPLAEQTGLIGALTRWVVDDALRQVAAWRAEGMNLSVAVNLSARTLLDPSLPEQVRGILRRHGLEGPALELEITESSLMADPARAREILGRLRDLGVRLAIDDFGVGHSSLAYLGRLPVDDIKVDRSFVLGMEEDEHDATIVRSTIELARSFGLGTIAEGVETTAAWRRLAAMGCDRVQGYLLSPPMPGADVPSWAAAWRERADGIEPAAA
jgi:diguanylate cyclase (GGDEF)-like protein